MSRPLCLLLLLLLFPGFASACSAKVSGSLDFVAYSFPDYKTVSQFQYADGYSLNDRLVIRSLNLTVYDADEDCNKFVVRPVIYLVKPNGEKGAYYFGEFWLKNGTYTFTWDNAISGGLQFVTTGGYTIVPSVERFNYPDSLPPQIHTEIYFNGIPQSEYPINVYDRIGKFKLTAFEIAIYSGISFIFVLFFMILHYGPIKVLENIFKALGEGLDGILKGLKTTWEGLKECSIFSALIMFSFAFTLMIIWMFMVVTRREEFETDIFSFVSTASNLFIPILVAFIGWKFLELQEKKTNKDKDAANKKLFDKISGRLNRVEAELELQENDTPQRKRGSPKHLKPPAA